MPEIFKGNSWRNLCIHLQRVSKRCLKETTYMKKTLFVLTLATLSATQAFAGTQAILSLKGVVAPILDISVAAEPAALQLELANAKTNLKVATVTEKTNYHTGYKIRAKSTHGGKLVNVNDSTSSVPYTLTYGNIPVTLTTSPNQIFTTNTKGTNTKDILLTYGQVSNLSAGSHEDEVQFTIEAN